MPKKHSGGKMYLEAPKNRKQRRTIYPRITPAGYPLAERLAARIEQGRAGQAAGTNPLGLMFPSPRGTYWRSSNFARRVLAPAYLAAGWRDPCGGGDWTWHSLAGHANVRITLDMYIGTTSGVLDRARTATE